MLRTLNTFAASLLAQEDLDDLLWSIAKNIGLLLGFEHCVVYLREGDELVQAAAHGAKNPEGRSIKNPIRLPVGQGIVGAVGKTGRTERVGDTSSDERYILDEIAGRSELAVALMYQDEVLGVIDSEAPSAGWYTQADQEMLEQVAVLAAPRIASALAQRSAEEALRRYESMVSASSDLMVFVDRTYTYRAVNTAYCEAHQKTREDVLGHTVAEVLGQELFETQIKPNMDSCLAGERVKFEFWWESPTRGRRHVDARYDPFYDADGSVVGVLVDVRDTTDSKQAEEALRQAQKMEAVGQLTAGMAHDFNNLLTVIMSNLELIADELPPQEALQTGLQDAQDASRRGAALIKKLMAFSRQESLRIQPVDLRQVLEDFVATVRRLLPETIEIELACEESCPPVMVDPNAVEQMLVNLATNARDAMPHGGVFRIEAGASSGEGGPGAQDTYVCISVSDTGVGMDEQAKRRIYEPFFTTKPPERGTGLGMAMVYGLVEQHEGLINIDSKRGQGTTVRIYVPVAKERPTAVASEPAATELPGGTETILLVEDEVAIRRAAQRTLERYGYTVLAAPDGQEALQIFRAQSAQIALVVSDVIMPRMSGPELYRAIEQEGPETKFMFMSGYSSRDEWTRVGLDPTVPLLAKPWTISEFLVWVRRVLDKEESG
ncbi:MAG: ATP-binding protein [Gemmatimonadales bacterium]